MPAAELVSDRGYEAPQGEVEAALATIWAETLGVERVGRNDNFFELGGDSLSAVQLVTPARRRMRADLVVRDVFEISDLSNGSSRECDER